ncbi:MAG: D-cysteine desulfhydrase family protein [Chloroflexota bacterium]
MQLARLPRVRLAALPTPLEEMPRLRSALGGGPRLFIKRDDNTGLALGGNKARKLEFLFADALAQGADTVITTGGPQSNHARMTAAAAAKLGLASVLVLTGERPAEMNGNLLIDALVGADIRFTGSDDDAVAARAMEQVAAELRAAGKRPYVVPLGGSNQLGTLGYVAGVRELIAQAEEAGIAFDRIYVTSGSAGTHGGVILGNRLYSYGARVTGISVSRPRALAEDLVRRVAQACIDKYELPVTLSESDVEVDDRFVGPGYAKITDGGKEAISLLARNEGIIADPVYTGKALAGMIDHIRSGRIGRDETVLFWHTGGAPALFVYSEDFR